MDDITTNDVYNANDSTAWLRQVDVHMISTLVWHMMICQTLLA